MYSKFIKSMLDQLPWDIILIIWEPINFYWLFENLLAQ